VPGARLKDITFENGSLTHPTSGADGVSGAVTLDSTSAAKGVYSARISNAGSASLKENIPATDDLYLSFYLKVLALRAPEARLAVVNIGSTPLGSIRLTSAGRLRLRNGSLQVGGDSPVLSLNTLYRIGLRQKRGTGANGVLEAYLAVGDAPFGAPFATLTNGAWTGAASQVLLGATGSDPVELLLDDIRLDAAAFAAPSSGATLQLNSADTTTEDAFTALSIVPAGRFLCEINR